VHQRHGFGFFTQILRFLQSFWFRFPKIPFSVGIPMSCALFFLVMCIQDYATSVNCELAEESETVTGWECDSFRLCIPIFGELTSATAQQY
jgi:hypothetical protein